MAYEFPRYLSKAKATTQQPSAFAAESTEGQITEQVAKVAGVAQEAIFKLAEAQIKMRDTKAELNTKLEHESIFAEAAADPDQNGFDKYYKRIEKTRLENLDGLSDDQKMRLNYEANIAKVKVNSIFRKKQIDSHQADVLELINLETKNPNENSLETINKRIDKETAEGFYDKKDAEKLKQKAEKEVKFNTFLGDFRFDPVATEKAVNENAYEMDIETQEKARSKLKELKAMQKEQEGAIYSDMSLRVTTGEISDNEIEAAMELNKLNPNEGITEAHGKQLKNALYRDITKRIGGKEFKKHKEAIDFVFSNSAQDRVKGYEAILEAYTDGLQPDEVKFLKKVLDTKKDIVFANKAAAGKKLLETLLGARPKDVKRETQSLLSYAKRIAEGASPETAAQQTATDLIQEDHPATVGDPDLVGAFTPSKGFKNIPKVKSESSAGRQKSDS